MTLHETAMDLAAKADNARITGHEQSALKLFQQAFCLEQRVAMAAVANSTSEPTRSVLLRSAASLAIECGYLHKARVLLELGISCKPPQEIMDELNCLLKQTIVKDRS